jgi:hypothetical protein
LAGHAYPGTQSNEDTSQDLVYELKGYDNYTYKPPCGLIDLNLDILENVDIADRFPRPHRFFILLEGSIGITDPCSEESSVQPPISHEIEFELIKNLLTKGSLRR